MADLNSRVESFITLLLDVSGRARPSDLEAHAPAGAEELLRQYADAHPEHSLAFEGDTLIIGVPTSAPTEHLPEHEVAAFAPEPVAESQVPGTTVPSAETPAPEPFVLDATAIPEVVPAQAGAAEPPTASETPFTFDPATLPQVVPASEHDVTAAGSGQVPEPVEPALPVIPEVFPRAAASVDDMSSQDAARPATQGTPAIPEADDSSFFEFGPGEDTPSAPAADSAGPVMPEPVVPEPVISPADDGGLVFVPLPVEDEDAAPAVSEPMGAEPVFTMPDLSGLPEIPAAEPSAPMSQMPDPPGVTPPAGGTVPIQPTTGLEGLDEY